MYIYIHIYNYIGIIAIQKKIGIARDDLLQVNGPNVYALSALCLWSSRWIANLESVILYPIISCFVIVDTFYADNYSTFFRGSLHRTDCCMCGKYPSDYCRLFCVGGFP